MNLLLLREHEVRDDGRTSVTGRRARHLIDVLGAAPGRTLRAGLIDGPLGTAEVIAVAADRVQLHCTFEATAPTRADDTLLLAVPRPKVLRRCTEQAAALGFGRIVLLRTWRVDKSHLQSHTLDLDRLTHHLLLGLEQAQRTCLPTIHLAPRFRPFLEDELEAVVPHGNRFVAHPSGEFDTASADVDRAAPITLAIGPERGFTDYEVDRLRDFGFVCVRAGLHPQRVETAIALVFGQLDLRRTQSRVRATRGPG